MTEPREPAEGSGATSPDSAQAGGGQPNALEKSLRIFADVHAGEGFGAILMTVNVFILLAAYYLLKPAREALILAEGGAEVKAYSSAGQALLLLLVLPFYGWIGTKVNRFALVSGSLVFFAVNLVLFFISGSAGAHLGVIFYIWVGIFSVFVISQFWAFANDIYTESQGRRLFAFIGVGSSLGALWGSLAATGMVKWMALTPYQLMATAAGLLMVSLGFVWVVSRHEKRTAKPESAALADQKLGKDGGFQLIFRDRYLLWIAVLMVLLNIVNTGGEYIMGKLVEEASIAKYGHEEASLMVREQFIGGFYGSFYSWMNFLGFALQAGAVSRVMKVIGVRGSLFVLPFISLASYSSVAAIPLLGVARIAKIFENSTDYSLQNTVKQALWLPTSREAKYKAKAAVDTFFMRFGDVLAAGVVAAGSALGAGIRAFSGFNVLLCGVWIWVAWQIKNEHKKRVA